MHIHCAVVAPKGPGVGDTALADKQVQAAAQLKADASAAAAALLREAQEGAAAAETVAATRELQSGGQRTSPCKKKQLEKRGLH